MILELHYRSKKQMGKLKFIILDILDAVPLLKHFIKLIFKRYDVLSYNLNLNLDKVKTDMVIRNKSGHKISEIGFSEIENVIFDYNKKYGSFATYPNMAIFISKKGSQDSMNIPLSKKSDFDKLQKELNLMGIKNTNNIHRKIMYLGVFMITVGLFVVYLGVPTLLDSIFSNLNK